MLKLSFTNKLSWLSPVSAARFILALVIFIYSLGLLNNMINRKDYATAFDDLIIDAARRHALSPALIKAVIRQESKFKPWAAGRDGEIGLMQITRLAVTDWERHTGRRCPYNGLLSDPRLNIEIGSWYLSRAFDQWSEYRDVETLALAQYNAGASRARQWAPDDARDSALQGISFPSTRQYIKNVVEFRNYYMDKREDKP